MCREWVPRLCPSGVTAYRLVIARSIISDLLQQCIRKMHDHDGISK